MSVKMYSVAQQNPPVTALAGDAPCQPPLGKGAKSRDRNRDAPLGKGAKSRDRNRDAPLGKGAMGRLYPTAPRALRETPLTSMWKKMLHQMELVRS